MREVVKKFNEEDDGAVTVDWVVLTAAIVGLGIAVVAALASSTSNVATNISSEVADIEVITNQ